MDGQKADMNMLAGQMLRLLPVQILLAAVGAVNGIVSSLFASNYVGITAMSAVGLFGPVSMLTGAVSTMLFGGATILCGKYMGRNERDRLQGVFSLDIILAVLIAGLFTAALLVMGIFDLTGFFTSDLTIRPAFNSYCIGQAIGILPMFLGNQAAAFLSLENRTRRTTAASLIYIAVNIILNFLFVKVLGMEAFGLALASSLGMWVFLAVQGQYFLTGKSALRFSIRGLRAGDGGEIVKVGLPGALTNGYQTVRGLIVNYLLGMAAGAAGLSAFAACNNLLGLFWSIPTGMLAVSRLMISVSVGEEDRQTLTDVMRVMFRRFLPIMCCVSALLIACAVPLTRLFYRVPAESVYGMTVWGFRILPLCMPLSVICMHFTCYGQASGKQALIHVLSLLDGVVCVAGFSALLIRPLGVNAVYVANVLNGVVTTLVIFGYACMKNRHAPRNMDELMVIPDGFGAPADERMDLTVRSVEDVVSVSERVQTFCLDRGIDSRRALLAGLAMEEMAGNIVEHGFTKDRKRHAADVRVVHKDGDVILRLKDDCVPFDPGERRKMAEDSDMTKNIGVRMIFRIARDVQYQNLVGMNVLTMKM